jgi:cell division protein FtsI (penicillin-binding protein 3)
MKSKITATFFILVTLFFAVIVKAIYVQIINRDKLMAYSKSQIMREVKVYPKRGQIYDRHGNPMAINVMKYNIFIFPKNDKHVISKIDQLGKITTDVVASELKKKSLNRAGKFTWLARKIDLTDEQLNKLKNIEDLIIEPVSSRIYPNNEIAGQLIGFVGIDNEGLSGLEYQFNEKLKGIAQVNRYYKDAKGRPVKYNTTINENKSEDIMLSIDKDIQGILEKHLKDGVLEMNANSGGAAVMDVNTGEILAIANYPSFDPNDPSLFPISSKRLAYVTDPIEPGSVFKALTIAAALDNNTAKIDTKFYCEKGRFKVGNHYITESDNKNMHEWLSVEEILKFSSNIGTTKIAFELGYPQLRKTLEKFHIGEKTGIEMSSESRGILDKKDNIDALRLSNISFGQGVATTGIHILSSYAVFANGGYYVKPTLLKVTDNTKIHSKRIITAETAAHMEEMLIKAVEDGTGSNAKIPHFKVAGKTSTSQRADSRGGYSGYISGFAGFPVDVEKKFAVFVYVDNPKKHYYGNTVAAPIFQKIVKNIIYKNKEYKHFANSTDNIKKIDFVATRQAVSREVKKGIMPNLIGLDKKSAFRILDKNGINYKSKGYGVVQKQSPEAGASLVNGQLVTITFEAPSYE